MPEDNPHPPELQISPEDAAKLLLSVQWPPDLKTSADKMQWLREEAIRKSLPAPTE